MQKPAPELPSALRVLYNRAFLYLRPAFLMPVALVVGIYYAAISRNRPVLATILSAITGYASHLFATQPDIYHAFISRLFRLAKLVPPVHRYLQKKLQPILLELEKDIFKKRPLDGFNALPEAPVTEEQILKMLKAAAQIEGGDAARARVSGAIYSRKGSLHRKVYDQVALTNPMHDDLWPRLQQLENESNRMLLELFHAPEGSWGKKTAGGTMSIIDALTAYRNRARDALLPTTTPNIVVPQTAHPAFKKGCALLGMRLKVVPCDPETGKVNLAAMRAAIDPSTILLVASAPSFPAGIIDPVEEVARLAMEYGIGCHVDCCLGSLGIPFLRKAFERMGKDLSVLENYDFRHPGVESASVDDHKSGEGEKGQSTIMYRSFDKLGRHSVFTDLKADIGLYASLGIEGSRPARVNSWAVMLSNGQEGYIQNLVNMLTIKDAIVGAVQSIPGIKIVGDPLLPIVAFEADKKAGKEALNILLVASKMHEKGWAINGLPRPAFHFCITPIHTEAGLDTAGNFIRDLQTSVEEARTNPTEEPKGTLGMYDIFRAKIPPGLGGPILEDVGAEFLGSLGNSTPRHSAPKPKAT